MAKCLIRYGAKLLEPCGQLKIKGGKPRFIVDDWNVGAGAGDPILTELQSLLQPLGVDVHVSNTPWRFFLSNCNSRGNGYQIRYDHHIQSCLKSDDALFDRQLESVQALLDLNAPRVVIITEPYGFGKTRVSAVAACCRFANQISVMIVDAPNVDFAAEEARHTTALVVKYADTRDVNASLSAPCTVLVIVKRSLAGTLAANMPRRAALIIMDGVPGQHERHVCGAKRAAWPICQRIADHHAFVTARSGTAATMLRRRRLWQQVNRFGNIAGAAHSAVRAAGIYNDSWQHRRVMGLAGSTEGWLGFRTSTSLTYKTEEEFIRGAALLTST